MLFAALKEQMPELYAILTFSGAKYIAEDAGKKIEGKWRYENGLLHFDRKDGGGYSFPVESATDQEFVLSFKFRVTMEVVEDGGEMGSK
ncbi:MAG: hypothetical protein V4616_00285, partial [Bacteroidota bacterium]